MCLSAVVKRHIRGKKLQEALQPSMPPKLQQITCSKRGTRSCTSQILVLLQISVCKILCCYLFALSGNPTHKIKWIEPENMAFQFDNEEPIPSYEEAPAYEAGTSANAGNAFGRIFTIDPTGMSQHVTITRQIYYFGQYK